MVAASLINLVLSKAVDVATHSWEYGTVAEAKFEWETPDISIWSSNPFPNNDIPKKDPNSVSGLKYLLDKKVIVLDADTLVGADGAAGDPASLGVPALLIGKTDDRYTQAADRQYNHLVNKVPRWPNGAISHREDHPELWADFVYMAPPFMAYYGVAKQKKEFLQEAARQCKLYHDELGKNGGAWDHIHTAATSGGTKDEAKWSTGNGWAAAGMSRVYATMAKSQWKGETKGDQDALAGYIKNILDAAIKFDVDNSKLLRNYLDQDSWWGEISGTALLAATAYRMAALRDDFGSKYTNWAKDKMDVIDGKINKDNGIVSPAINPLDWHDKNQFTTGSPEGQSFVVLLHAAERDFSKAKGGKMTKREWVA